MRRQINKKQMKDQRSQKNNYYPAHTSPQKAKTRPIEITSQYKFYDLISFKRQHTCNVRIPQTVLIDRGFIKDWIYNSKDTSHPILKKHHDHLAPLNIIKSFCAKLGYGTITNPCKSMLDLYTTVLNAMKQQKNFEYVKDKKVIEILTTDNEWLCMSLLAFLELNNQNKLTHQLFYDNWKIIQDRVSFNKIQEEYQVQTVRDSHGTICHKCHKVISVLNGFMGTLSTELYTEDPFKEVSPSKNKATGQSKSIEGYKFFDTHLNKKFFHNSEQLVETVEKNLKCTVERINVKYVINKEREPYFMGINELIIKPSRKIAARIDYQAVQEKGYIKIDEYLKPLLGYYAEKVEQSRLDKNRLNIKKGKKCKGQFCDCKSLQIPPSYLMQQKSKLPSLMDHKRKISMDQIESVRKRRGRVIERMKQFQYIEQNFQFDDESSSEYESEDSQQEKVKNIKVCENCYLFYLNVLKVFDLDSFGNLVQKKNPISMKTVRNLGRNTPILKTELSKKQSSLSPNKQSPVRNVIEQAKQQVDRNRQQQQESFTKKLEKLQTKRTRFRSESLKVENSSPGQPKTFTKSFVRLSQSKSNKIMPNLSHVNIDSSASPVRRSNQARNGPKLNSLKINQDKLQSKLRMNIYQTPESNKNLKNISKISSSALNIGERPKQRPVLKKLPESFNEALSQLLQKLSIIPSSSQPEFIYFAKKYFKDNYPQYVDRRCLSSEYLPNLYDFLNNSPIILPLAQRIKKRPEMSMKRLSELSGFPQIVSRSTFLFDTLICDQKTTIPFCVISTKMLGNIDQKSRQYENIIIFTDMFDSFIQYISVSKNMIENFSNKRVILFNRPGQSHTIYNQKAWYSIADVANIVDKLLYRLCQELKMIDFEKDAFKFIGVGYGGYLLTAYLGYNHFLYQKISGVLLINSFARFSKKYTETLENLYKLYKNEQNDPTVDLQPFLFYNKAIQSSQITRDDMDKKSGLNSIRIQGRIFLLNNILSEKDSHVTDNFEQVSYCPVQIVHSLRNTLFTKPQIQQYLIYQKNQEKKEIPLRKFFEVESGYDIMADNFDQVEFRMIQFARLGYDK